MTRLGSKLGSCRVSCHLERREADVESDPITRCQRRTFSATVSTARAVTQSTWLLASSPHRMTKGASATSAWCRQVVFKQFTHIQHACLRMFERVGVMALVGFACRHDGRPAA